MPLGQGLGQIDCVNSHQHCSEDCVLEQRLLLVLPCLALEIWRFTPRVLSECPIIYYSRCYYHSSVQGPGGYSSLDLTDSRELAMGV